MAITTILSWIKVKFTKFVGAVEAEWETYTNKSFNQLERKYHNQWS